MNTDDDRSQDEKHIRTKRLYMQELELLNDRDNFIGIGSLDLKFSSRLVCPGQDAPDGWLWLEPPVYHRHILPDPDSTESLLQNLFNEKAIRCTYRMIKSDTARVRIYVLPDDVGRGLIRRFANDIGTARMRKALKKLLGLIDVSRAGWEGEAVWASERVSLMEQEDIGRFISRKNNLHMHADALGPHEGINRSGYSILAKQLRDTREKSSESLFYMFNTLKSPKPDPKPRWIKHEDHRELIDKIAKDPVGGKIKGMRTCLYRYQRQSVAMMLQRELGPENLPDVRLQRFTAPTGEEYYMDFETMEIFQDPKYYEDVRGGILSEEMGLGKTIICLALIMASKYQWSYIPDSADVTVTKFKKVPSLVEACVSCIWQNSIPWGEHRSELGESCINAIEQRHGFYEVQAAPRSRSSRYGGERQMEKIYLGTGTIVVCPPNLIEQWRDEISKHIEPGQLKVLYLSKTTDEVPPVHELLQYDVVIFSRGRFDKEDKEGKDNDGRRESGGVPLSCQCPFIGASRRVNCVCFNKNAVYKSPLNCIRWKRIIVDEGHTMSSSKTKGVCVAERLPVERRWLVTGTPLNGLFGVELGLNQENGETEEEFETRRKKALAERKVSLVRETQHLDALGRIVRDFLKLQPWATQGQASWNKYIIKGFNERGTTTCIREILQRLIIRHQPEDIKRDVQLSHLDTKYVYLKPGYYEKLSTNLFLGALAANAVTSERQDQDYMFHPRNRGELRLLVNNLLKQSGFFWSGFSKKDVESTVRICEQYLVEKKGRYSREDCILLKDTIRMGKMALECPAWNDLSKYDEMGYFIDGISEKAVSAWSLSEQLNSDGAEGVFLLGGTQVVDLQSYAYAHAFDAGDADSNLQTAGRETVQKYKKIKRRQYIKPSARKHTVQTQPQPSSSSQTQLLPPDSPYASAYIRGTTSTKLSYLLDRVVALHETEKILIFYEAEDIAVYIAQALKILGIEYLGYSKDLDGYQKSQCIVNFHNSEKTRVLIMDLTQAAHGLNVSSASRVFFINPVWQSSIEAQAIKRAHRIGQDKTVYVETLVLEGTLEEEMLKRRNAMTKREEAESKDSVVSDWKMRDIISGLKFLRVAEGEGKGLEQVAMLKVHQAMFEGQVDRRVPNQQPKQPLIASSASTGKRKRVRFGNGDDSQEGSDENDVDIPQALGKSSGKKKRTVHFG